LAFIRQSEEREDENEMTGEGEEETNYGDADNLDDDADEEMNDDADSYSTDEEDDLFLTLGIVD
jgi:hypothetical protein